MIIQCLALTNNRRFREMTKKYISVYDCGLATSVNVNSYIRVDLIYKYIMLKIYAYNLLCDEIRNFWSYE